MVKELMGVYGDVLLVNDECVCVFFVDVVDVESV